MNVWNQAPIVRLIIPLIAGILAAVYFPFQFEYGILIVGLLAVIISALILIPKLNFSYKQSSWFGIVITVFLFVMAYQLTILKTEKFASDHFSKFTDSTEYVYGRLAEPYLEKAKSLKAVVKILAVRKGNTWQKTSGRAMIYFKKDVHSLKLDYGDEIIMKADFKKIPAPQNPGEFNYQSFLAFHNVFEQAYIKEGSWVFSGNNGGNSLMHYSISLRNSLLKTLTANHLQGDEFSVGAALLLGYTDKLDAEIISAYSSTGALHVLSVSGLHVAIIYIVFSWLLFFMDKIKYGSIIKALILIAFLWFYSMLTGLSPSVLRSAAMLSFIIIAKTFNRHTNVYNTLAASAFFLLLFNPYLIMDVGFQLSYLAVLGIVYIQPKIHKWLETDNWLLEQIWTITSVSIAAQIATFPLGLHYFHQFPNYFLISNFIVIPVSTVIMYSGIALFAFAKISFIASYLALAFNWSIWFLNASVKLIETWPYALMRGISISAFETWLIYGLIILFFAYFTKPKFKYLLYALVLTAVILSIRIAEDYQHSGQKKLIVYNIPKISAVDFISAKSNVLLTDTALANHESALLFHVKHNWWELGLSNSTVITSSITAENIKIKNNFIQFMDKRIAVLNDKSELKNAEKLSAQPINLDYLIISKNAKIKMAAVLKLFHAKKIIFDSSNSEYIVNKWKADCIKLNQPYYSVTDSGAFIVDI